MSELQEFSEGYLKASIAGDKTRAREVIEASVSRGLSVFSIYNDVISPALQHIGAMWENEEITVCQEHLATQITLEQMTLLRELISPKPFLEKTALITTLPNDQHIVGARMVADYFYADGWTVEFLGSNTPVNEIVEYSRSKAVDVVLVSLSNPEFVDDCRALSEELGALEASPRLIAGGRGVADKRVRASLPGVDLFATDPLDAVREARKLTGVSGSQKSLDQTLRHIGQTIRRHRTDKGLNQKSLSRMAELDRAYLSSIENGKKNLTVSAMLRISEALGISLEELIRG